MFTTVDWFTFHYVSIKSYIEIFVFGHHRWFTFHYVSIKSAEAEAERQAEIDLHSTMYLLNLDKVPEFEGRKEIYIPLCIY